jgi:hypothetical protein
MRSGQRGSAFLLAAAPERVVTCFFADGAAASASDVLRSIITGNPRHKMVPAHFKISSSKKPAGVRCHDTCMKFSVVNFTAASLHLLHGAVGPTFALDFPR